MPSSLILSREQASSLIKVLSGNVDLPGDVETSLLDDDFDEDLVLLEALAIIKERDQGIVLWELCLLKVLISRLLLFQR